MTVAIALSGCGRQPVAPSDAPDRSVETLGAASRPLDPAPATPPRWIPSQSDILAPETIPTSIDAAVDLPVAAQEAFVDEALLTLSPSKFPDAVELFLSGSLSKGAMAAIFEDVFLREPALKLPSLVRIASQTTDPVTRGAALAGLADVIGRDYGTNWSSWADAIDLFLTSNGHSLTPDDGSAEPTES